MHYDFLFKILNSKWKVYLEKTRLQHNFYIIVFDFITFLFRVVKTRRPVIATIVKVDIIEILEFTQNNVKNMLVKNSSIW